MLDLSNLHVMIFSINVFKPSSFSPRTYRTLLPSVIFFFFFAMFACAFIILGDRGGVDKGIKSQVNIIIIYRVCQKKERHFKYICKVANN